MKFYHGQRTAAGSDVEVIDPESPHGGYALPAPEMTTPDFDWGCGAPGQTQLAEALLVDALGDAAEARRLAHDFKLKVVARLPHERWELSAEEVRHHAAALAPGRSR